MDKQVVVNVLAYLKKHVPDFVSQQSKRGNGLVFVNPLKPQKFKGQWATTCTIMPGNKIVFYDLLQNSQIGDIVDIAKEIDKDAKDMSREQILYYLSTKHSITIKDTFTENYLNSYLHFGFDLVPLVTKSKSPFEKEWPTREHKNIEEWKKWIENGFNIGVKTGLKSNITVIDVDTQVIPDCLKEIYEKNLTLIQQTKKGFHFIFKYDKDIPTGELNDANNAHWIDILNDGKQFVTYPSMVDGMSRKWNYYEFDKVEILTIPDELKKLILGSKTVQKEKTNDEKLIEDIKKEDLSDLQGLSEGGRNNGLTKLGGILRKQLNINQTEYVMKLINRSFVKPSLADYELKTIVGSLDKYAVFDDIDLAKKIADYLRYAEEGLSRDIQQAIGESKTRIDKALAYLIKEQVIVKRGRMFHLIKKAEWVDTFPNLDNSVPFKMPYFDDIANFSWGDMVLLGAKAKVGKTTISMNVVKRLVEQKIKPYYICLETGSRFIKTAANLGMKEGDFFWSIQTDPTKIEIENNSVTILDWLLIEDKAKTDSVMQYFVNQLVRTNSLLIVFMQLKSTDDWFAPNMVTQFPAFASRYLYEKDDDGTLGSWHIDAIRESKRQVKKWVIPCKYDWESRRLLRLDEIQQYKTLPTPTPETNTEVVI